MLVYIAQWAELEREPEDIVDCDPWIDSDTNHAKMFLKLTKKTAKGQRIMSIQLDRYQVEMLVKMAMEAGMIKGVENATQP